MTGASGCASHTLAEVTTGPDLEGHTDAVSWTVAVKSRLRPFTDRRVRGLGVRDRVAVFVALASTIGYLFVRDLVTHAHSSDLVIYRGEGRQVLIGGDLYGRLPLPGESHATYPPFAALLFVVLSAMSVSVAKIVVLGLNVIAVYVACALTLALVARDQGETPHPELLRRTLLLGSAVLWCEPVVTTLRYGQINLLLLCLVLLDFAVLSGRPGAGVAIGLASAIKVTPLVFIVYLAVTRRFRAAGTALATFLATIVVSACVLPSATWRFWTSLVFDTQRVGRVENAMNQTVRGLGVRIDHVRASNPIVAAATAAVIVLGVVTCVMARRHLGEFWAITACATTTLLASPIAWSHHWVWCVPMTAVLLVRAPRWAWLVLPFWTYTIWLVPHSQRSPELHLDFGYTLLSALYVVTGIAFLCVTLIESHRGAANAPPGASATVKTATANATGTTLLR